MLIVRFASRVVPACGASLLVALLGCAAPAAADSQQAQLARSAPSAPGTDLGTFVVHVTAGPETPDPARVSVDWSRLDPTPASGTATGGANGLWRTNQLPYGKYELTVRYADGVPRTSRVVLDESRERVDMAMPHGRIVIRTDRPVQELSVRCVSLWQGTAVRAWQDTTDAQLAAEGLAPGQYIVHATYDKGGMVVEHVRLTDAQSEVVLDLQPVPPGEVQLALTGWSGLDDSESFLVEAYAQTPVDRKFDFGEPILARSVPRGARSVTLRLPPGRFGLLISSRSTAKGRTGLLAFLPDVVAMPGGVLEETADLATPRRVLVRGAEGELSQQDFSFRFGADLLPARLITGSPDLLSTEGVLLPSRDCAVVGGFIRRLIGLEGGTVADVLPGTGVQEIELALE